MNFKRLLTLFIGLACGVVYAFLMMLVIDSLHANVSIAYIFALPIIMGAIPVLFATREQLQSYLSFLLMPWLIVITFFCLSILSGFEGMLCLVIIFGPFVLLGSLGAFISKLLSLRKGNNKTPLYCSLFLPLIILVIESNFKAKDQFNTVTTTVQVSANRETVWNNIKNVKNIKPNEIKKHFIHMMGIPKPLNGQLDKEGVGAIRSITWQKGIKFQEIIYKWDEYKGFAYNIKVDPKSIPPTTLDEHVMIGGRYFDVIKGSYQIIPIDANKQIIKLTCEYRITTNLNFYSKWWADAVLNDFNEMILEVIKKRSEDKNYGTIATGKDAPDQ